MNSTNTSSLIPEESANTFPYIEADSNIFSELNNKIGATCTLLVPKLSKAVAGIVFSEDDVLLITNRFEKIIRFYFSQSADSSPTGIIYELPIKDDQVLDCCIAKAPENKFLIFINDSEIDAEVYIEFI